MEKWSHPPLDTFTTSVKKSQDFIPSHQCLNHSTDGSCYRVQLSLKKVKNKVLCFPSNFWPDLCRGNTEKGYTQAKKESLSSETWRWNESHRDISFRGSCNSNNRAEPWTQVCLTAVKIKMVFDSFRLFPLHSLASQSLQGCCCSPHLLQLNPAIIQ